MTELLRYNMSCNIQWCVVWLGSEVQFLHALGKENREKKKKVKMAHNI